jgi:hypothetical protein
VLPQSFTTRRPQSLQTIGFKWVEILVKLKGQDPRHPNRSAEVLFYLSNSARLSESMRRSALAGLVQIILVNGTRFVKHQVYQTGQASRLNETIDYCKALQGKPDPRSTLRFKISNDLKNISQLRKSFKKTDFRVHFHLNLRIFPRVNLQKLRIPALTNFSTASFYQPQLPLVHFNCLD